MIIRPRTIDDPMFCCNCGAKAHQILLTGGYGKMPFCNPCLAELQQILNQIPVAALES